MWMTTACNPNSAELGTISGLNATIKIKQSRTPSHKRCDTTTRYQCDFEECSGCMPYGEENKKTVPYTSTLHTVE